MPHQQHPPAASATVSHSPVEGGFNAGFDGPLFASIIDPDPCDFATVADLRAQMADGLLSAVQLVTRALARIAALDAEGPRLNAVIELNPDALSIARRLDSERACGCERGPLHGIPVLLKDNIQTGDRMQTSAGSLALVGAPAPVDAVVVERLRNAGAVILGKTNMTEWAAVRDLFGHLPPGWSQRGGQTRSALGRDVGVSGSSSGSAVAVSAGFVAVAVGTETSGSILSPARANRIVGMRPTLGLLNQAGLIPVSKRQDTAGPMARSVCDAALLLSVMAGVAETRLDAQALQGARLGYPVTDVQGDPRPAQAELVVRLERAGAILVPVPLAYPQVPELVTLLLFDFKRELADYLAQRPGIEVRNLTDVIRFNRANPAEEGYGQGGLEEAELLDIPDEVYQLVCAELRAQCQQLIDTAMLAHDLAAFVEFGGSQLPIYAAAAGYPGLFVPAGRDQPGSPAGLNFTGTQGSDQRLLSLGYAFEQVR